MVCMCKQNMCACGKKALTQYSTLTVHACNFAHLHGQQCKWLISLLARLAPQQG